MVGCTRGFASFFEMHEACVRGCCAGEPRKRDRPEESVTPSSETPRAAFCTSESFEGYLSKALRARSGTPCFALDSKQASEPRRHDDTTPSVFAIDPDCGAKLKFGLNTEPNTVHYSDSFLVLVGEGGFD